MFFPEHFALYELEQLALHLRLGVLKGSFPHLPFDCLCINVGGRAQSSPHKDFQNVAWGLCCVGVFGHFAYEDGGQLLLQEMGIELELRRGDIVFLPSALITHWNRPLKYDQDRRWSVVFYTPGANFRWLENGGKAVNAMSKEEQRNSRQMGGMKWEQALNLFPMGNTV